MTLATGDAARAAMRSALAREDASGWSLLRQVPATGLQRAPDDVTGLDAAARQPLLAACASVALRGRFVEDVAGRYRSAPQV